MVTVDIESPTEKAPIGDSAGRLVARLESSYHAGTLKPINGNAKLSTAQVRVKSA